MLTLIVLVVVVELALVVAAIGWLAHPSAEPAPPQATMLDRPTLIATAVAAAAVIAAPMLIKVAPKPAVNAPVTSDQLFQKNGGKPTVDLIEEGTGKRVTVPFQIPPKK